MHFDVGWMASKAVGGSSSPFSCDGVSEYHTFTSMEVADSCREEKNTYCIVPPLETAIQSPNFDASLRLVNAASASSGGVA